MNNSLTHAVSLMDKNLKHVLELGVFKGGTIRQLRKLLPEEFEIFGFDSFEGIAEPWIDKYGKQVKPKGAMSAKNKIPEVSGVKLYKGWFSDTLPQYIESGQPIGLLHVDCDLYSSTIESLRLLNHLIVPNTVIVFDEWVYNHDSAYDDHEQKAFFEWTEEFDRSCRLVDFNDTSESGEERKIVVVE